MKKSRVDLQKKYFSLCQANKNMLESLSSHILLEDNAVKGQPVTSFNQIKQQYQYALRVSSESVHQNQSLQAILDQKIVYVEQLKEKIKKKSSAAEDLQEEVQKASWVLKKQKRHQKENIKTVEENKALKSQLQILEKKLLASNKEIKDLADNFDKNQESHYKMQKQMDQFLHMKNGQETQTKEKVSKLEQTLKILKRNITSLQEMSLCSKGPRESSKDRKLKTIQDLQSMIKQQMESDYH